MGLNIHCPKGVVMKSIFSLIITVWLGIMMWNFFIPNIVPNAPTVSMPQSFSVSSLLNTGNHHLSY